MFKDSKKHLDEVNETYFKHLKIALRISAGMIAGGFKAALHAIIPGVFVHSASKKIKELNEAIERNID